ncbi:tubulin monoglycylase TTLL3-like isoform X2 [Homarus americanus]|uniref:tubulin monoglycylase TTLL3-like isoform X2 n=1 Tax=Homarus americanus TaxID=6706 RepID=UPI001C453C07|nr:tubulin monoglycylase TTLL3-like isoform X2 [Homarus americanus]
MKVAIPGRAIKMQEHFGSSTTQLNPLLRHGKIPFNNIEIRPTIDYLALNSATQSAHGLEDSTHLNNKDWKRTTKFYKKELKAKGNIRPSTAVRRHVKKISEEFTMTQTKYENSVNTSGSVKTSEGKDKFTSASSTSSSSSITVSQKLPQSKFSKNVFSKITCSKCESLTKVSRKNTMAPLVTSAVTTTAKTCNSASKSHSAKSQNNKSKNSSGSCRDSGSPQKKLSSSLSPPGSSPRPRHRHPNGRCVAGGVAAAGGGEPGLAPNSPALPRSPGRKGSSTSLGGISPRSKQMSSEQIRKVKVFTERAIMEGRVFSIFGYFPAIKDALRRRGWVEKIQHSVPYVNPHPNNCVCPHVGYQASFTPSITTTAASNHISTSSGSSAQPGRNGSASTRSGQDEEVKGDIEDVNDPAQDNTAADDAVPPQQTSSDSSPLSPDKSSSPPPPQSSSSPSSSSSSSPSSSSSSSSSSSETDEEQQKVITANQGSSNVETNIVSTKYENPPQPAAASHTPTIPTSSQEAQVPGESSSITEGTGDTNPTQLVSNRDSFNTAILGPSEIRKGLASSITEKNATIFKYSTTHIPKKTKDNVDNTDNEEPLVEEETNLEDVKENEEGETQLKGDEEGGDEGEEGTQVAPEPYCPYIEYELCDMDLPLVARLLRNVEPNFLWTWTRDSISFKHLSREQMVNRFPNTPFTTKYGLCETLQQLHWFSEAASVESFVPRGYCIGHEDERTAFIHDYRLTACLNMLKWLTERYDTHGPQAVTDPHGEVPMKRVRQALAHVEQYIQSCCHDDLDAPPPPTLRDHEWDALLAAHYKIVHMDKKIKIASPVQLQVLVTECESAVHRVVPYWPQLSMDGLRNLWIVKPGAQSRGRGIFMMNHLEEILALVQSPLIYETKYVVQKYMERPLLIHNTKFDIRQWFMVTDWNPLHVWVYKESYLRFCSQQYDLTNNNEAVHLSNNAIQCKYLNGERSGELPDENMWDCHQFKEYLRGLKKEGKWEEVIYPGMRDALVAAMLAAQVEMDSFKHGFELFGADFMLTEDLRPWLIEINSSPCMAATTSVTRRMCAQCLHDVIKVVVDYKHNKTADTGLFELAYRDSERSIPNPPYLGVNLQVVGRQIKKGPLKAEKRKAKKARPAVRVVKPLPLITLSLEEGATQFAPRGDPSRDTNGALTRHCSLLDCRKYASGSITSLAISNIESIQSAINESDKLNRSRDNRLNGCSEGNQLKKLSEESITLTVGESITKSSDSEGIKHGSSGGPHSTLTAGKASSVGATQLDWRGS